MPYQQLSILNKDLIGVDTGIQKVRKVLDNELSTKMCLSEVWWFPKRRGESH